MLMMAKVSEKEYQAEEDLKLLVAAQKLMKDAKRMKAARDCACRKYQAVNQMKEHKGSKSKKRDY